MLALMGGDEFRPACREMDRALLAALGLRRPRVIILPTAAALQDPERAASNGIAYFRTLDVDAAASMVLTREDAEKAELLEPLKAADLLYFVGGSPTYLLETLQDTAAWRLISRQHRGGQAIAGSSAGAMVLAEKMLGAGGAWVDALGLLPGVALLPHYERQPGERGALLRESLDQGLVLLGVDSATACINLGGPTWQALGTGRVAVYREDTPALYRHGQTFALP